MKVKEADGPFSWRLTGYMYSKDEISVIIYTYIYIMCKYIYTYDQPNIKTTHLNPYEF